MSCTQSKVLENIVPGAKGHRTVRAFAALGPGQALQPWKYEPGPLGPDDVELAVTHCGVCHTDLHLIGNEMGISAYPLVPGHEAIGTIVALGEQVRGLSVGQRVGVGFQRAACDQCELCQKGLQTYVDPYGPQR